MDGQLVQLSCPRDLTTELMALMDAHLPGK